MINFTLFCVAADESNSRRGTVSPIGVTFATKADAQEAIRRGAGDAKNPFVGNICSLQFFNTDTNETTRSTATQIAPDIFLVCKHAIETGNGYLKIISNGKNYLVNSVAMELHPEADLALIKLTFDEGRISDCDFLPFAVPIKNGDKGIWECLIDQHLHQRHF